MRPYTLILVPQEEVGIEFICRNSIGLRVLCYDPVSRVDFGGKTNDLLYQALRQGDRPFVESGLE